MNRSVLIIERPTPLREALLGALREHGVRVDTSDDAMDALAHVADREPDVVLVSDDAGAPGSESICRILGRRWTDATLYRLGTPAPAEALGVTAAFLPRELGAQALASALLESGAAHASADVAGCELDLGPAQLGELLLALAAQHATGTLSLSGEGHEREVLLLEGVPVHARSTHPAERLGALALRRELVTAAQLDAALRLARREQLLLGTALQRTGALQPAALFELLADQTREQLEAACSTGATKARFVATTEANEGVALFPVHPLTVLASAARRMPRAALAAALDRAASRPIVDRHHTSAALGHLRALGLDGCLEQDASTLAGVRVAIAERLAASAKDATHDADCIVFALAAAGVVRLGEPERPAKTGTPSLPPPPIGGGLVRALDARPALATDALAAVPVHPAHDDWTRALRAHLHGSHGAELDRAYALGGAAAEREQLPAGLLAAYVRLQGVREPWQVLGVSFGARSARIRIAFHAQLDALDRAAADGTTTATTLRKLELRRTLERARDALLSLLGPESDPAHDAAAQAPPTPTAAIPAPAPLEVAPPAPPAEAAATHTIDRAARDALAELEPLVRQNNWQELLVRVEQKYVGGETMPPGVALLYALAAKEAPPEATRSPRAAHADMIGIRAMSELLQVPEDSDTALVIAKRALRKRPIEWQKEPPKRFSITLMIIALIFGAAVGLFVDPSSIPLKW